MRDQLENIRNIDLYLTNSLSESDKNRFEKRLIDHEKLRKQMLEQKLLIQAINRIQLRAEIESISRSSGFNAGTITAIITVALICIGIYWLNYSNESLNNTPQQTIKVQKTNNSTTKETLIQESFEASNKPQKTTSIWNVITHNQSDNEEIMYNTGGLKTWVEPSIQKFKINPSKGATIEGEQGTLIIVPTDAFIGENGDIINQQVDFELIEAYSIEDMVLYNLNTISGNKILESGGMFYLNASSDGKLVKINPKRPLYIEIPTHSKKEDMMAFEGRINSSGDVNWVNPRELQKYMTTVDFSQLDFLPSGFADGVKDRMPFRSYNQANKQLIDSLYFSLNFQLDAAETLRSKNLSSGILTWRNLHITLPKNDKKINREKSDISQGANRSLNDSIEPAQEPTAKNSCGIDPISIKTIKTRPYAETFIATREFEKRVRALHQLTRGQEFLELYLNSLDKNLWEIDKLVMYQLTETNRELFRKFSTEKLTNTKDGDIYQTRLTNYYQKKHKELSEARRILEKELENKNTSELNSILDEIKKSRAKVTERNRLQPRNVRKLAQNFPKNSVANSQVYATTWYTLGWGNIDAYLHMLEKQGSREMTISVSKATSGQKIYQWLNTINTLTGLNFDGKNAIAVFPKKENQKMKNTYCFALGKNGTEYSWAYKKYNPYVVDHLNLEMKNTSIENIRSTLKTIDSGRKELNQQVLQIEKEIKKTIEENNRKKEVQKQLRLQNELYAKLNKLKQQQQKEKDFIYQLRTIAFNCNNNYKSDDKGFIIEQ